MVCICVFQVRTLFVSGLPMDAKPRELYLLFRSYKVCVSLVHKLTTVVPSYIVISVTDTVNISPVNYSFLTSIFESRYRVFQCISKPNLSKSEFMSSRCQCPARFNSLII